MNESEDQKISNGKIWNWFNKDPQVKTEDNIFDCIKVNAKRIYVHLKSIHSQIWTVSINTVSKKRPLVMVHGFCGGIGMWATNLRAK